jgi:hypothetical protein
MTRSDFLASLKASKPPEGYSAYLQALWYDAKGDWGKSHELISEISTPDAALIHAYLHRKEGDQWNADYWYRRALVEKYLV